MIPGTGPLRSVRRYERDGLLAIADEMGIPKRPPLSNGPSLRGVRSKARWLQFGTTGRLSGSRRLGTRRPPNEVVHARPAASFTRPSLPRSFDMPTPHTRSGPLNHDSQIDGADGSCRAGQLPCPRRSLRARPRELNGAREEMVDVAGELERAREYHRRQEWADACDAFLAIDRVAPLAIDDLGRLAESTHILGRIDEAVELLQRLYRVYVDAADTGRAVRTAFYLWHSLVVKGEFALAGGWIARARRLAEAQPVCAERGFLLVPEAERRFGEGDFAGAFATAELAAGLADQLGDHDLVAIAAHIQGRARIRQGRVVEGLALLDEALVEVTAGATSAGITSWIYCSVIDACRELHELRRAREWTLALNAWCDYRPQYTGVFSAVCRIHRAELLLMGGAWPDAAREAQLACEQLTRGYGEVMAGAAFYQLGEVYRLRGDIDAAGEAYRNASRYGGQTQPGLALLWLTQGNLDASVAAIRRALAETTHPLARSRMLPAYVEIMLAGQDAGAARAAAAELDEIAQAYDTAGLQARSAYARGAVRLADGTPDAALPALRHAWRLWSDLDAPYEAACTRVLIGLGCRALRDEDSAVMELDAARHTLAQLGALSDVARIDALIGKDGAGDAAGLSPRELDVLRLIAAGKSNQAIAAELLISDRTVERHVSNIFLKLGVGSRTAAAAYAFVHRIH
jgi:DNA-binding CsgD family transcriptional regulator